MIFASFSDPEDFARVGGLLIRPAGFSLEGYRIVLTNKSIWLGYRNTMFYVWVGTFLSMIVTSFGAYALSRSGFLLKKAIMLFIIFTMFFGGGIIPTYLLVRSLGMINTVWAILIPSMVATWNLIILRTAFQSIPESLIESVKLDGANDFVALFRIVLPLSKPALAAISLFYAVAKWNEWFSSVLYLTNRSLYPLQMFLRELLIMATTSDAMMEMEMSKINAVNQVLQKEIIKYATIIVATVPILALYPFLQKYFVKGVMIGSLKE